MLGGSFKSDGKDGFYTDIDGIGIKVRKRFILTVSLCFVESTFLLESITLKNNVFTECDYIRKFVTILESSPLVVKSAFKINTIQFSF